MPLLAAILAAALLCVPALIFDPDLSSRLGQVALGCGIYCAIFGPMVGWIAWREGIWK